MGSASPAPCRALTSSKERGKGSRVCHAWAALFGIQGRLVPLFLQRTAPPLMRITWPVMNFAAGDASQRAAAATSCGVPQRPRGVSRKTRCCHFEEAPSPHAVLIHPGARQLTRTDGASESARLLVNAITAALLAPKS